MDLDDLKERWTEYDRRLDTSLRLNTRLLREMSRIRVESALRRLSPFIVLDLLVNFVAVLLLGGFVANHLGEARFLTPAVMLDVFAIVLVAACIHQLVAAHSIDYSAPIVAIQRQLERLRIERIRITKWTLLLAPLIWAPALIVSLEGFFGMDAYVSPGVSWLAANLLFGAAVIPLMLWASRRYADRLQGSPFVQSLMRDIGGSSLSDAIRFLGTLSSFEEGNEPV